MICTEYNVYNIYNIYTDHGSPLPNTKYVWHSVKQQKALIPSVNC